MRKVSRAAGVSKRRQAAWAALWIFCGLAAPALAGQEMVVELDPAKTTVAITLGATMHTVHGTFHLKSGKIHVDPATGKASGAIVVDATSGDTDNSSRDQKMHRDVLESAKFSEIVFSPATITAPAGQSLKSILETSGNGRIEAAGTFQLHGQDHPMTLELNVQNEGNGTLTLDGKFGVPYVAWGLKSPNNFLLRVSDAVDIEIHSSGEFVPNR